MRNPYLCVIRNTGYIYAMFPYYRNINIKCLIHSDLSANANIIL